MRSAPAATRIAMKVGPVFVPHSFFDHTLIGFGAQPPRAYDRSYHAKWPMVAFHMLMIASCTKIEVLTEDGSQPLPLTLHLDGAACLVPDMARAWNWHRADAKRFLLDLSECGLISDELAVAAISRLSTSRMRGVRAPINKATRAAIMAKTSGRCVYCGVPLTIKPAQPNSLHVDHLLAVRDGATDDPALLVPACGGCNQKKGAKTLTEFIADRGAT